MSLDLGLHLLRSGYRALPEERSAHDGADAFTTSLLGRRAVVVRGREGARLFYDGEVTHRRGAVPPLLAGLLFGRGAVHGLDGADHATRKAMFLEILSDERVDPLAGAIGRDLDRRTRTWRGREVPVFDELVLVYGAAVQAWAGIPAPTAHTSRRLAAIVDGFGGSPVAYPRAWAARLGADRWATRLVREVRSGAVHPPAGSVLQLLAGGPGRDLDARTAGIELLNILRPTVAVAWPGTFLARALSEHPSWRSRLVGADANGLRTAFGHEVRRTCPFAPALAARAHRAAQVDGVRVEPGDFVVLDIPGTGRDPTWWADADEFRPERFADLMPDPFAFVPQGGGDPDTGHRCPGEPLTVRILSETARVLAGVDYEPVGDTSFDPTRIPTLPRGGFVVRTSPD